MSVHNSSRVSPRIAVVGTPGSWSSEALADALEQRTGFRLIVDLSRVNVHLDEQRVWFEKYDLCELDGLVIKKVGKTYGEEMLERLEALRYVEARGVRVISRPAAIARMLNRLSCTITLSAGDIPIPPTRITEDLNEALSAVRHFRSAVLKPLYSTKARGMKITSAEDPELTRVVSTFFRTHRTMYIQQRVPVPKLDLGLVFLGGSYLGTYARVKGEKAWNTTTRSGGSYQTYRPSRELIELASRAQALFDLELTSVDIVETDQGPLVFEVSAFGGFRGLTESSDRDVPAHVAEYAIQQVIG